MCSLKTLPNGLFNSFTVQSLSCIPGTYNMAAVSKSTHANASLCQYFPLTSQVVQQSENTKLTTRLALCRFGSEGVWVLAVKPFKHLFHSSPYGMFITMCCLYDMFRPLYACCTRAGKHVSCVYIPTFGVCIHSCVYIWSIRRNK